MDSKTALETLSGLWPQWKATEHEQQLCRDRLAPLRAKTLVQAMQNVKMSFGGKTPPFSRIAAEYDTLVRAERAATQGPESSQFTPNFYFVYHWERREGYANSMEVAMQLPSAEQAHRFFTLLPEPESKSKAPRVSNCLGRRFDVAKDGLIDTVTGAFIRVSDRADARKGGVS